VDFVVYTPAVKKKIMAGFDMSDRTIPLLVEYSLSCYELNVSFLFAYFGADITK
jgi:hypothetical protein